MRLPVQIYIYSQTRSDKQSYKIFIHTHGYIYDNNYTLLLQSDTNYFFL